MTSRLFILIGGAHSSLGSENTESVHLNQCKVIL